MEVKHAEDAEFGSIIFFAARDSEHITRVIDSDSITHILCRIFKEQEGTLKMVRKDVYLVVLFIYNFWSSQGL